MSDTTHINLLEVEDSVQGRAEGLEGRFGRGPMGARDNGVSHWRYAPGFRNPIRGPKPEGGDGETAPAAWPVQSR